MHTIIILSDTIKSDDHQIVCKLKELFPDCNIQILSKTAKESKRKSPDSRSTLHRSGRRPDDYMMEISK